MKHLMITLDYKMWSDKEFIAEHINDLEHEIVTFLNREFKCKVEVTYNMRTHYRRFKIDFLVVPSFLGYGSILMYFHKQCLNLRVPLNCVKSIKFY